MPKTAKGIYHNLKESEYAISNLEVAFFFSSKVYRNKFMSQYEENRKKYEEKMRKFCSMELNYNFLADLELYKLIEKRGFRVVIQNRTIDDTTLHHYCARSLLTKVNLEWQLLNVKVRG